MGRYGSRKTFDRILLRTFLLETVSSSAESVGGGDASHIHSPFSDPHSHSVPLFSFLSWARWHSANAVFFTYLQPIRIALDRARTIDAAEPLRHGGGDP